MVDFLADLAQQYAPLLVSICALFLTISQAKATRKHNRLTVKPHLTSFTDQKPDPERKGIMIVKVTISNNGLGPAIIKTFEPLFEGVPFSAKKPDDLSSMATKVILNLPTFDGQSGKGILALKGVCHGTQGTQTSHAGIQT